MNDISLRGSSRHIIKMHVRWRLLSALLHEFRRDKLPSHISHTRAAKAPTDSPRSAQSGSAIAAPPCGRVANNFTTDHHLDCFDHRIAISNANPRARATQDSEAAAVRRLVFRVCCCCCCCQRAASPVFRPNLTWRPWPANAATKIISSRFESSSANELLAGTRANGGEIGREERRAGGGTNKSVPTAVRRFSIILWNSMIVAPSFMFVFIWLEYRFEPYWRLSFTFKPNGGAVGLIRIPCRQMVAYMCRVRRQWLNVDSCRSPGEHIATNHVKAVNKQLAVGHLLVSERSCHLTSSVRRFVFCLDFFFK